ncbi:unnamed protein product, partial [Ectocarpus sp. 13 AM-2016]
DETVPRSAVGRGGAFRKVGSHLCCVCLLHNRPLSVLQSAVQTKPTIAGVLGVLSRAAAAAWNGPGTCALNFAISVATFLPEIDWDSSVTTGVPRQHQQVKQEEQGVARVVDGRSKEAKSENGVEEPIARAAGHQEACIKAEAIVVGPLPLVSTHAPMAQRAAPLVSF